MPVILRTFPQEAIGPRVFMPFALFSMKPPMNLSYAVRRAVRDGAGWFLFRAQG